MDPLNWIDDEVDRLEKQHLLREPAVRRGPQSEHVIINGRRCVNFGSNDYLGLANDARLAEAACNAIKHGGWGSGASPLITGRSTTHEQLECQLAAFEQTEGALLFPSGFAANVGTISALMGKGDVILSDAKNHASIIDGCRLSGADIHVYPHNDVDVVVNLLEETTQANRRLIVTDGLFSMDGDMARLPELAELAERHNAILLVDEAHGTGVLGENGRGACELLHVESGVHIRIGTFSKALGSIGGFVVGQRNLIRLLLNRARSYVFSTALPESACAASLCALHVVRDEPQRRTELLRRASRLRESLQEMGWSVAASRSQIIPLLVGDSRQVMQLAEHLQTCGIFVPGIRPPTVPKGESLLRVSLTHAHTAESVEQLIEQLRTYK